MFVVINKYEHNLLHSSYCYYCVIYQCQFPCFTIICKSMFSSDSKAGIICKQNLTSSFTSGHYTSDSSHCGMDSISHNLLPGLIRTLFVHTNCIMYFISIISIAFLTIFFALIVTLSFFPLVLC